MSNEADLHEMRCLLYEDGWDAVGSPQERLRKVLELRGAMRIADLTIEHLQEENTRLKESVESVRRISGVNYVTVVYQLEKLKIKYNRVREQVRQLNKSWRQRRDDDYRKRYKTLLIVAEQLTFATGKLVAQTDDFTWIRMTKPEFNQWQQDMQDAQKWREAVIKQNETDLAL